MCSTGMCPFRRTQASTGAESTCATCPSTRNPAWPVPRNQMVPCPIQKSLPSLAMPNIKATSVPTERFAQFRAPYGMPQFQSPGQKLPKLAEGRANQGWPMQPYAYSYFSHYVPVVDAKMAAESPCDFEAFGLPPVAPEEDEIHSKLQWVGEKAEPILVTCSKPKVVTQMPQFDKASPYAVESDLPNPKGWYQNYKTPIQHPLYTTSNSAYGAIPPNVHTMSTTYYPMDHSFTEALYDTGMYRDHAINTGPDQCKNCPPDDKKLFP